MIYKVTPNTDIFEDNPGLAADEYFSVCTSRELKFIFLMHDFESPYAKMSIKPRLDAALEAAGFKRDPDGKRWDKNARTAVSGGVKDRVKRATAQFTFIQRHSNREKAILAAIDAQLDHIIANMEPKGDDARSAKDVLAIIEKLPKILETRVTIMEILRLSEEDTDAMKTMSKELSTLDEMHLEGLL